MSIIRLAVPGQWAVCQFSLPSDGKVSTEKGVVSTHKTPCSWTCLHLDLLTMITQSCPTFLQPHGLLFTRLLCPQNSPGKNTGVGSHSLLQRIFPPQGLNPGLLHCRRGILYHLSHLGSAYHTGPLVQWFLDSCCIHPLHKYYLSGYTQQWTEVCVLMEFIFQEGKQTRREAIRVQRNNYAVQGKQETQKSGRGGQERCVLPIGLRSKEFACQCSRHRCGPWIGKVPRGENVSPL